MELHSLFPTVAATEQLRLDPLQTAAQLQTLMALRGDQTSNPDPGCAWTGDLNGIWQLHGHDDFRGLADVVVSRVWDYLARTGFDGRYLDLHLQRCWPVVSEWGQVVGRHHHPNAHLSAVVYLSGEGSGNDGALCLHAPHQLNELVPGLAVGHGGPIRTCQPGNQHHWLLAPQPGLLVLFPSRLDHSVLENTEPDGLRVSVSFDFVLTARAEGTPPEYLSPHPKQWQPCQRPMP
ncbi:MAG: putative 2OG-Fe(II) oxygenase [Synechococcus sp.]